MESQINRVKFTLTNMGLNEYQASALAHLIHIGETKATTLSKASGVPNARIYGILDELSKKGLIITRPGRPALYAPMTPEEISAALIADARHEIQKTLTTIESHRRDLTTMAQDIYLKGGTVQTRIPLLRIVGVGETSLEETRKLYQGARSKILILTRAMEWLPEVTEELLEASKRGASIQILMRSKDSLSREDAEKRDANISKIEEALMGSVEIRASNEVPIRGCIVDPDSDGRALFLVEEKGVPFIFREAAITSHPGVVRGLTSMFELKWTYDSEESSSERARNVV